MTSLGDVDRVVLTTAVGGPLASDTDIGHRHRDGFLSFGVFSQHAVVQIPTRPFQARAPGICLAAAHRSQSCAIRSVVVAAEGLDVSNLLSV